jgi:arsenite methyltransferase
MFALSVASFLWATWRGKFSVWAELLNGLNLNGNETLLDVGCGRGAVLIIAAKRLPCGRAVGVDIWSKTDQSGNSEAITLRNAEVEGVADRVALYTADMRALPFSDQAFDIITSSLAIHNIPDKEGREQALEEILRVLKPGGTALVADILHVREYARFVAQRPEVTVQVRHLDWRFWYGGPQAATSLATITLSPTARNRP